MWPDKMEFPKDHATLPGMKVIFRYSKDGKKWHKHDKATKDDKFVAYTVYENGKRISDVWKRPIREDGSIIWDNPATEVKQKENQT